MVMFLDKPRFDPASKAVGGEEATAAEIWDTTRESMRVVDNANSRLKAWEEAYDARIAAVKQATGVQLNNPVSSGAGGPSSMAGFGVQDETDPHAEFQRRLEELAAEKPELRDVIKPDRPVLEDAKARAQAAEKAFEDTWSRSSGGLAAWAARLGGGFYGAMHDPVNIFTLPLGPTGKAGTGAKGLLWMGLKQGAANAGTEAMIQPFVQQWRKDSNLDYGLGQAALNIAGSGLFGAAVDIGVRAPVRGVRRAVGRPYLGPDEPGSGARLPDLPEGAPPSAPAPRIYRGPDPLPPMEALEQAARNAPEGSVLRRASEGDEDALRQLAAELGPDADPAIRRALDELEIEKMFTTPLHVDGGEHHANLARAVRGESGAPDLPVGDAIVAPVRRELADIADEAVGRALEIEGRKVDFRAVDPRQVTTDAATFQFKSGGDAAGVTDRLRGVTRWDPVSAGKAIIFERADGQMVIADGHQRLGLAQRVAGEGQDAKLDAYVFREADGWTPEDVRAYAALKNMRESSGTSLDMAQVMRDRPDLIDGSLPLTDAKLRDAAMLARLSPEAFDAVVAGRLPPPFAALIGESVADSARHRGLLDEMAEADLANTQQARLYLKQLMELPTTTETQMTLFGEESFTRTVLIERAQVLDSALKTLKQDKRIFGLLGREADKIEGAPALGRDPVRAQSLERLMEAAAARLADAETRMKGALIGAKSVEIDVANLRRMHDKANKLRSGFDDRTEFRKAVDKLLFFGDPQDILNLRAERLEHRRDETMRTARQLQQDYDIAAAEADGILQDLENLKTQRDIALGTRAPDTALAAPAGTRNILAREANQIKAERASQLADLIEKLATSRGPVATILNDAAASVARGLDPKLASRAFVDRIADTLEREGLPGLVRTEEAPKAELAPVRMDDPIGPEAKAQMEDINWALELDDEIKFAMAGLRAKRYTAPEVETPDQIADALRTIRAGVEDAQTAPLTGRFAPDDLRARFVAYKKADTDLRAAMIGGLDEADALARYADVRGQAESIVNDLRKTDARINRDIEKDIKARGGTADDEMFSLRGGKADQTQTPEFKRWFGDSKVVDEGGKPLVVYHGTKEPIEQFDPSKFGVSDEGLVGRGFHFTYNPEEASGYALNETFGRGDSPNVVPVYVSLKNPFVITHGVLPDGRSVQDLHGGRAITSKGGAAIRDLAEAAGHDGIVFVSRDGAIRHVVAWKPEQIKSAIGNRGTFDPTDPRIAFATPTHPATLHNTTLSTRAADEMASMRAEIDKAVAKSLPPGWRAEVRQSLVFGDLSERIQKKNPGVPPSLEIEGTFDPYEKIIYVSLAALDPVERAYEEAGHALKAMRLIPQADYAILAAKASEIGARQKFRIDERYGDVYGARWKDNPARLEEALEEEAIMQMVAARARGDTFGRQANAILDKLIKFLRAIRDMLGVKGFRTFEDVFEDMTEGGFARAMDAQRGSVRPTGDAVPAFAFAGEKAATADKEALALAERMAAANASRDDIWRETGWFQGVDGKWRFEIADDTANLANTEYVGGGITIFQGLDHPELTAAYGQQPSISGYIEPGKRGGGLYRERGTPQIEVYSPDAQSAKSLLLHEVQHDVQVREGFARGEMQRDDPTDRYHRSAGEVEARNVQTRLAMTPEERRAIPPWATQDVPDAEQVVRLPTAADANFIARAEAASEIMFALGDEGKGKTPEKGGEAKPTPERPDEGKAPAKTATPSLPGGRESKRIRNLINQAAAEGKLPREDADALIQRFDMLEAFHKDGGKAKQQIARELDAEAEHRKRQKALAEGRRRAIVAMITGFRDARGQADPARAMQALIENLGQHELPQGFTDVAGHQRAIYGMALADLDAMLHEFRKTLITGTTRNKAQLANVVRELHGEATGDELAAGFAQAVAKVMEDLRLRFNAAGGNIAKRKDWHMPQSHDKVALLKAGKETWIDFIHPLLDLKWMKHPLTGDDMPPAEARKMLGDVWDNLVSDGWHEREAAMAHRGVSAIANTRADPRSLIFANADAWMKYSERFGSGDDALAILVSHIRGMTKDIAAMEVLGPNPKAMLEYLKQFVIQQATLRRAGMAAHFPTVTEVTGRALRAGGGIFARDPVEGYAKSMIARAENMWNIYSGASSAPVNATLAAASQTIRNVNVATKLGGATVSALSDPFWQIAARKFAGLPATRIIRDVVAQIGSAGEREARRAGVIAETYLHLHNEGAREGAALSATKISAYVADRVLSLSMLNAVTRYGNHAMSMGIQGHLADMAGKAFADLDPRLQRMFRRWGLEATDWDAIRLDAGGRPREVDFLSPADIRRQIVDNGGDPSIAERYLAMTLGEAQYATLTGSIRGQAIVYGSLRAGTAQRELWSMFMQFKSFAVNLAILQLERIAREFVANGFWRGAQYAGYALVAATVGGALIEQLQQLRNGKDPRDMTTPEFWGSAAYRSGGLSIWGDLLYASENRFGGGVASTIAGPSASTLNDILNLTYGSAKKAVLFTDNKERTNFGREATNFVKRYTPGASLWYVRTAWERVLMDNLQRMLDPEADASFRRKLQNARRDYKQEFWWKPGGGTTPQRLPSLGAALPAR